MDEIPPIVNQEFLLHRMSGKGGWTYIVIPGFTPIQKVVSGMVKVKGSIDSFELKNYRLMPMKSGELFLPVKAEIRKKIKKESGDTVHLTLFENLDSLEIPEEFLLCLKEDKAAYDFYFTLSESQQVGFLDWIYSAKKEETKVDRIAQVLNKLVKREKYF